MSEPVIECKECKKAGKKVVIDIYSMEYNKEFHRAFVDTANTKHIHTGMSFMGIFVCSNGHTWTDRRFSTCACGWSSSSLPQPTEAELLKQWEKLKKKVKSEAEKKKRSLK